MLDRARFYENSWSNGCSREKNRQVIKVSWSKKKEKGRWSSRQRWILIKGFSDCYGEMNRSNVLISWIIRGENGTISPPPLSLSRGRLIISEAVFSLDRILIAIRRARFDIRWRGLGIEAATFHWIGSMLIVKSITIFLWTLLISGRGRERRVLLSSALFPSLPSLSFSFRQHWPRKIKLRMLVTGVRRRNAWTIRDRTQNSTRYSPVRWKSWQRVVIPIPFRPHHPPPSSSSCHFEMRRRWERCLTTGEKKLKNKLKLRWCLMAL